MKKRERSLVYRKFQKKIKARCLDCFYYKIPDTAGLGGKRPFDSILIIRAVPIAIEFKSQGDKTTKYQDVCLGNFGLAGGIPMIYEDGDDMDNFITRILEQVNLQIINHSPLFTTSYA